LTVGGFLQFDPDKWEPEPEGDPAKVAKVAKAEPTLAGLAGLADLPADVADGLERLARLASPRGINAGAWAVAIQDAQRLAGEGWALSALRLGWQPIDLFGAVVDPHGDPHADGLAVKLAGRPLLALCGSFATVRDGPSARSYLYRGSTEGARLLWELGRGR
jgi:hypothetical protein